jgi:hypothetical protein
LPFFPNAGIIMVMRQGEKQTAGHQQDRPGLASGYLWPVKKMTEGLLGLVHGTQAACADVHLLLAIIYHYRDFLNIGFPMPVGSLQRERPVVSKLASFAANFTLGHRKSAPFTTQTDAGAGAPRQRKDCTTRMGNLQTRWWTPAGHWLGVSYGGNRQS